jgi:hypothetical protein
MDLRCLGISLRLRWLWLQRTEPTRSWASMLLTEDHQTKAFFKASFRCRVGNGESIYFWSDPWLQGCRIADLAPDLCAAATPRRRARQTVASALQNHAWIQDIIGPLAVPVLLQYLDVRQRLQQVRLSQNVSDRFAWRWSASGNYSSRSAYTAMFFGEASILGAKELWKVRAPKKCKFFHLASPPR